jgi:hypothetical protein
VNPEILIALVATILTGGTGALSAIFGLGADFFAQHAMSSLLGNPAHTNELQALRARRAVLATNPPDTQALQFARTTVGTLAAELPRWQEKAVTKTLEERSGADSAEYIIRLVDAAVRRLGDTGTEALTL